MQLETKLGDVDTFSKIEVIKTVATVRDELIRKHGLPYTVGYLEGTILKAFQQLPESDKSRILSQMLDKVNLI